MNIGALYVQATAIEVSKNKATWDSPAPIYIYIYICMGRKREGERERERERNKERKCHRLQCTRSHIHTRK